MVGCECVATVLVGRAAVVRCAGVLPAVVAIPIRRQATDCEAAGAVRAAGVRKRWLVHVRRRDSATGVQRRAVLTP